MEATDTKKIQFTIESKKLEVVSISGRLEDREEMFEYAKKHGLKLRSHYCFANGLMFKVIGERDVEPTRGME